MRPIQGFLLMWSECQNFKSSKGKYLPENSQTNKKGSRNRKTKKGARKIPKIQNQTRKNKKLKKLSRKGKKIDRNCSQNYLLKNNFITHLKTSIDLLSLNLNRVKLKHLSREMTVLSLRKGF
jgi:hypothetical protein